MAKTLEIKSDVKIEGEVVPTAIYADADKSKGTIAQRLEALGFKMGGTQENTSEGYIKFDFLPSAQNYLDITKSYIRVTRQGNYTILYMNLVLLNTSRANDIFGYNSNFDIAQLPEVFRPSSSFSLGWAHVFGIYRFYTQDGFSLISRVQPTQMIKRIQITDTGRIYTNSYSFQRPNHYWDIQSLYESQPIQTGYANRPIAVNTT